MKNSRKWGAVVYWAIGFVLTSLSALVVGVYLVAKVRGVQPEALSEIIAACLSATLILIVLPALAVALDLMNDSMARYFHAAGQWMTFCLNLIAAPVCLVLLALAVLFVLAFRDELIGSPDEDDDSPPKPLYRRVWGGMKTFFLAVLIMVLPNKDGEVPD
jgi:cytochrome bd-type quinol oxidase subunit 2